MNCRDLGREPVPSGGLLPPQRPQRRLSGVDSPSASAHARDAEVARMNLSEDELELLRRACTSEAAAWRERRAVASIEMSPTAEYEAVDRMVKDYEALEQRLRDELA